MTDREAPGKVRDVLEDEVQSDYYYDDSTGYRIYDGDSDQADNEEVDEDQPEDSFSN